MDAQMWFMHLMLCLFQEGDGGSIADILRATAEEAMTQTGFVFDETTGMYYDHSTGFYYDSVCQLFFCKISLSITELTLSVDDLLMDILYQSNEIVHIYFLFFRPASCTMMPTLAFTTTMMQRVDDTSFIPGLRYLLHRLFQSLAKIRTLLKGKAGNSRKGTRKPHSRMMWYVMTRSVTDA